MHFTLPAKYDYLRIAIASSPASTELGLRKALQDSLMRTFGVSAGGTYVDILRFRTKALDDQKSMHIAEAIIRVAIE